MEEMIFFFFECWAILAVLFEFTLLIYLTYLGKSRFDWEDVVS